MRVILLFLFTVSNIQLAISQVTLYNAGTIKVNPGGVLFVNGNVTNSGAASTISNDGLLKTQNSTYQGDFTLETNATGSGKGDFEIDGDWINDAAFITDATNNSSKVNLTGGLQLITGANTTTFYDLELSSNDFVKTMTLDVKVTDSLLLHNNELSANNYRLFFLNQDSGALTNDLTYLNEGFVSTQANGSLVRVVNASSKYSFPVGSSNGTARYRSVDIKPINANVDTFFVGMFNYDPTGDGFDINLKDSILCKVNDLYYHKISRRGTANADVSIYYDQNLDPYDYNGMAQWTTPTANKWNNTGNITTSPASGNYRSVTKEAWTNFTQKPFALTIGRDTAPHISSPVSLCKGADSLLFTASGSQAPYSWQVPTGSTIISGQGSNSILVHWGQINDTIIVYGDTLGVCKSLPGYYYSSSINTALTAAFTIDSGDVFADHIVQFQDQSSAGVTSWHWDLEANLTSTEQNPATIYSVPGIYKVILTVYDQNACKDTASLVIDVKEYVKYPNVFSPNGDGINDYFTFPFAVRDGQYNLEIYNRWGQLLFVSTSYKVVWDGNNLEGTPVPNGVYYFVLKASASQKDYSKAGSLTLLR